MTHPLCSPSSGTPSPRSGWTLIELLGVLAVVTILALAVAPALLKEAERRHRDREDLILRQLADGLQNHIARWHTIPNHTTYASLIGAAIGMDPVNVVTNRRGLARIYVIDPTFRVGATTNATLPYTQTVAGSAITPVNPRIVILSSLSLALPSTITNGFAPSSTTFNAIWSTAANQVPSGWTWNGDGADLKIQRINLEPLFIPLTLNNNSATYGRYALDNTNHVALTANTFTNYVLRGTSLGLYGTDGGLQSREIIQDPRSYVYEQNVWRGKLFMTTSARRLSGLDLQAAFEAFMASPANTEAKFGTTQAQVTGYMYQYMSNYIKWAISGFSSAKLGAVQSSQTAMADATKNYMFKAGTK